MSKKRRKVKYSRVNPAKPNLVLREVDYIVGRAVEMESRVVTLGQLQFFSTQTGDAWMLDPEDGFALCLLGLAAASSCALSKRLTLCDRVECVVPIRG